ncbi:MAG: hypothetical protein RLZ98_3132 [Pseudomonadota bacterium]|jgi:NADPH:quinone reductase-like Zn-dependent oxidoreductase
MKAAYINRHGGPEVFEYGEFPDPTAGDREIVVDIHAASVNAADWKVRKGQNLPDKSFPYVMGRDFSGVVHGIGPGAGDFAPGDEVYGVLDEGHEGTYAERVAINQAIVARKPDGITHAEAAALSLTGLTAIVAIEDTLRLAPGETILIQGGAGGVAGFAIQLAKHIGARVITTASPGNHAYVQSLGADDVIDYHSCDFRNAAGPCDAVFDTVGRDVAMRSFDVLKPGGRLASVAAGRAPLQPPRPDLTYLRPKVGRSRAHLERITELVAKGAVRAPTIATYQLCEAGTAHSVSESRHLQGKLVFTIR